MDIGRLVALLQSLEGFRDYPYDDQSPWPRSEVRRSECIFDATQGQYKVLATRGTATIGWGETDYRVLDRFWGRRITQAEATAIMVPRVQVFADGVGACIKVLLTAHQLEACACRAYQTGAGGFCRSAVVNALNAGDVDAALVAWRRDFAHPDRSEVEIAHFLTPDEGAPMEFVSRSEWGALSPTGRSLAAGMTLGIGIHWLGDGRGPTDHDQCAAKMREVQAFHMGPERRWADFAYNAAVCCHGSVFEGRGPSVRNAANGGGTRSGTDANAGWASVLYLAGTDGPELTPEAKDGINDAAAYLKVADGEWLGHRDFLSTECPGDDIYGWVHGGHPRSGSVPDPNPQQEDYMALPIFGDGPDDRGGGLWMLDGIFRKQVHTTQVWDEYQRLGAQHVGDIDEESGGKFGVAMFDATIDIEKALVARIVERITEGGVDIDVDAVAQAVADVLHGRLEG